ncbi:hypothetical protein PR048_030387 [Dryococelus australis]|uniref:Uncharacterized protein n=1 Tax=Dryococelus australis TaxID=614101 RepID=A0ABQ9GCQ5_9NEOP|nr:hypothetical protein PR048_030387 [Dryococelus australis]
MGDEPRARQHAPSGKVVGSHNCIAEFCSEITVSTLLFINFNFGISPVTSTQKEKVKLIASVSIFSQIKTCFVFFFSSYNQRKLEELPYQMFQLHKSIKQNFLFEHSWLFDKLCGAGVYDKPLLVKKYKYFDQYEKFRNKVNAVCYCINTYLKYQ